jgi:hypothetical protein
MLDGDVPILMIDRLEEVHDNFGGSRELKFADQLRQPFPDVAQTWRSIPDVRVVVVPVPVGQVVDRDLSVVEQIDLEAPQGVLPSTMFRV